MPIPQINKDTVTREDVIEAYEKDGWSRELIFNWVEINPRNNMPILIKYRMAPKQCNRRNAYGVECSDADLTFLKVAPSGVIWQCYNCRKTDGVLETDSAQVLSRREISMDEAEQILEKTGQRRPIGFPTPRRKGYPKLKL